MSKADKHVDGVGRFGRPSRHRPPGHSATAEAAHGERRRAYLPGPPGEVNTARPDTDTWPAPKRRGRAGEVPEEGT